LAANNRLQYLYSFNWIKKGMAIKIRTNLEPLRGSRKYDICVIGSGPAGTVTANSLVEKGVDTILLESGNGLAHWVFDKRLKNLAAYEFSGDTDYPLTKTKARLVGGNSNFWTGRCERLHPSDFENHAYTPAGNPWPVTYDEMAPFYEMAENTLRVRGSSQRTGDSPPRQKSLPVSRSTDISFLEGIFGRTGVKIDDSPTATPTKTIRFFKVQKEILPHFLKSPNGTLVSGVTATRLLDGPNRSIDGVEIQSFEGHKEIVRAKIYVAACGGIENPRLLMLSKSEQFPEGIGNSNDMVGRGFNEHPAVNLYARIPHSWGTIKPTNKIARTHQYYSNYREEGLGSILPVFRQAWILPHHVMPFKLSKLKRNLISAGKRFTMAPLYIGATIEQKISDANRVILSENQTDCFGNPLAHLIFNFCDEDLKLFDRCRELANGLFKSIGARDIFESDITWSRHHQGTCRMGDNPQTSVVNANLRVHETPNLYICGSDVFVTGGAMQPCLSIVAFAHRLANHLVKRLRQG
jgi:choline dehydrogenase-like flavoprotein